MNRWIQLNMNDNSCAFDTDTLWFVVKCITNTHIPSNTNECDSENFCDNMKKEIEKTIEMNNSVVLSLAKE